MSQRHLSPSPPDSPRTIIIHQLNFDLTKNLPKNRELIISNISEGSRCNPGTLRRSWAGCGYGHWHLKRLIARGTSMCGAQSAASCVNHHRRGLALPPD